MTHLTHSPSAEQNLGPTHNPPRSPPLSEANPRLHQGNTPLTACQRSKTSGQSHIRPAHGSSAGQNLGPAEKKLRQPSLSGAKPRPSRHSTHSQPVSEAKP
ncbi:hypothetical protein BREU_3001 [Bifidobacterium reuteri DSM 23975]|uniref:Uncharacterized protein n=1 Tax=Bifidobacterium reuteri DSM 23975 TaxID=1437610 RepID=A0A087CYP7_9BIFI|nr:hypothetical protein BREU_3001 [Bifidobacterium reuteri DSM 23975]